MAVLSKMTASRTLLCNWTISDFSIASSISNLEIQRIIYANQIFTSLWNHNVATSQKWRRTKETSKPALCKSLTTSLHLNNRFSVKAFTWVSCISISTTTKILNKGFPTTEPIVNCPMKSLCLVRRCSNNGHGHLQPTNDNNKIFSTSSKVTIASLQAKKNVWVAEFHLRTKRHNPAMSFFSCSDRGTPIHYHRFETASINSQTQYLANPYQPNNPNQQSGHIPY